VWKKKYKKGLRRKETPYIQINKRGLPGLDKPYVGTTF
jgi:hypothetical protein